MSEYEIRSVGGHVEVYTRGGVFLFSADTVREAFALARSGRPGHSRQFPETCQERAGKVQM